MTPQEIHEIVRKSGGLIQPSPGDVHVNVPLTNISVAYAQSEDVFIADRVFPMVPVMKRSDVYYEFDREAWLRDEMRERAPGTESSGSGYTVATEPYLAKTYAHHKDIDDQTRANADSQIGLDRNAARFVTNKGLIQRERNFASVAMADDVWTFKVEGHDDTRNIETALFSDVLATLKTGTMLRWSNAMSTPITDFKVMKRAMQMRTGHRPNVAVMGRVVYDTLTEHEDIIDRLNRGQTSGTAMANMDDLKRLLELEDIIVMDSIYATNVLGATAKYGFVGDDDCLLLYRPMAPGLEIASAGYMFSWRGLIGTGDRGMRIKRFRMEQIESDRVELQQAYVFKIVGADLGIWMEDIV